MPLYSNAAGVMPVVSVLRGTVLAFMMPVVALSLPVMIIPRRMMKPRLIATFIAIVAGEVAPTGYLFNAI